jgi:hypothetical protein
MPLGSSKFAINKQKLNAGTGTGQALTVNVSQTQDQLDITYDFTTNIGNTFFYYSIEGDIESSDFTDNTLTGTITTNTLGLASLSKTVIRPSNTETLTFNMNAKRGSSESNNILDSTANLTYPFVDWREITASDVSNNISTYQLTGSRTLDNDYIDLSSISNYDRYRTPVAHPNGKIYMAPSGLTGSKILELDVDNQTVTEIETGLSISSANTIATGCLGGDNKIYWFPQFGGADALVVDPEANTFVYRSLGAGSKGRYTTSTYANGKIYAVGSESCCILDTVGFSPTVNTTFGVMSGNIQFRHPAAVRSFVDDKIYHAPYGEANVLVIDPSNDTAEYKNYGITFGAQQCQGISNGKNGNIYLGYFGTEPAPYQGNVYEIDVSSNTASIVTTTAGRTFGSTTGPDGNVYCLNDDKAFINVSGPTYTKNQNYIPTNPTYTRGAVQMYGHIYTYDQPYFAKITVEGTGLDTEFGRALGFTGYVNNSSP